MSPCQQVLKKIQKTHTISKLPWIRKPITLHILQGIYNLLIKKPPSYNSTMTWAACYTAFFGFLRSSELTVPSQDAYDPSVHLSVRDVAVNNKSSPTMVHIRIKQSKTADSFCQGVSIHLGETVIFAL